MSGDAGIRHVPVLADEVLGVLAARPPAVVLDGTVGLGGHARRILERFPEVRRYVGVDRDEAALERARATLAPFGDRVYLGQASFEEADRVAEAAGAGPPDAVLLDLGTSMLQLKDPGRGFSFVEPGPLDMRMDRRTPRTAADVLRSSSAEELQQLFSRYGEFRFSRTLARALAALPEPPQDTVALTRLVHQVIPARILRERRKDPTAQVFQALRIAVNDELGALERALPRLFAALAPGGVLAVISFHSLEDRRVKTFFRERLGRCTCPPRLPCQCGARPTLELLTRRPTTAGVAERAANPPSRPAKLRAARKL